MADMSIQSAYERVLGRTPSADEVAYWQSTFGNSVDPVELSTFSVAAQPELAAAAPTNTAVRDMYQQVLGRAPDASGLQYFAERFGTSIDPTELGIFQSMAAEEVAANAARNAAQQQAAAAEAARVLAAQQQAATTAGTGTGGMAEMAVTVYGPDGTFYGSPAAARAAGVTNYTMQPPATAATTTTGMSIADAYQRVLGRAPSASEVTYWQSQFGSDVDPTELSTFSVAAQPERAAAPTTNSAIRQMYLSVLGREPDASGLQYFADRFGTDVDADELGIFRGMATQEINANAARNAGTTNTGTTAAGMSIISAYQQVLGRTPNAQEIAYWTTQFGSSVDPTELSTFSTAAGPELTARTGTGTTTRTTTGTVQPITRPTTPRQVTGTQLAPARVTNTAITGTPFRNIYTPSTMQQNAPTLAQINAASQSANPYQSLMSLTPQRTLSPAYAAQAGLTAANTNLGGFNPAVYNPATTTTGLLGGGATGATAVEQPGSANTSTGTGMAGTNNQAALSAALSNLGFAGLGQALATSVGNQLGSLTEADILGGNWTAVDPTAVAQAADTSLGAVGAASSPVSSSNVVGTSLGPLGAISSPVSSSNVVGTDIGDFGGTGGLGGAYSGGSSDPALNYKGGLITRQKVKGPNPPGPDDGYSGLDIGEYVIKKSAVKKYGANIFEQINAGRIPAQRLKSLLE